MEFNRIDFYYFSGTGNTLLVVKKMKEVFEKDGISVHLYRLEKTDPKDVNIQHTIGLGFPVAEQGTYPFVWEFIHALPPAHGTPIFLVDTLMAFSGGIVGPVRKIVEKKGYTPIGAKEIIMPNNLFPKKSNDEKTDVKVKKGFEWAENYAIEILRGKSKWGRIPLLSDFMGIFSQRTWAWNFIRKMYCLDLDSQKCSQCGLCVKLCPIGNIEMKDYPEYKNNCVICMRCISFCPKQAIYARKVHGFSSKEYTLYKAVKVAELLKGE
jgi:NAD-dependent dihydropyrimidine dehydrogenase PreA subunit/flavodoxin